jgi:RNA polymerase sigma-70 factor, ECF subfamily
VEVVGLNPIAILASLRDLRMSNRKPMGSNTSTHDLFLSLMESHKRALLKVCWAYGPSSHDRDDLLQEMASRLWAAFGKYDANRKFSTWMYRIALNVAIDWRRRQHRFRKEIVSLESDSVADAKSIADSKLEQLADLRELMERQSDADRAILLLHLEGASHREVGEILGLSESNVGTRLNRIKNNLRTAVEQQNEIETGA